MTFFCKSWEQDISHANLAGIIFCHITLFIYPVPQIFSLSTPNEILLFSSAAGVLFMLFALGSIRFLAPQCQLDKVLGIAVCSRKSLKDVLICTPLLLFAIGAVTWHWKYTLEKLDIPFEHTQQLLEYADLSHPLTLILLIIMAVGIIPPVEEILFRRVIFGQLAKLSNFNIAGFITAGLFSAAHSFAAGIPGLFIMGLTLQWMYSKNRNLADCIILHALFNAISIGCAVISKTVQC